jgi:cobyrinic acid a,c-diamide synthase
MIIAGERSGVGKTTITLAILAYLTDRGDRVQSFKVGPDYIDPMFHSRFTGRPCRNLDPFLTSEEYVKNCFARHASGVDRVVIEGVMGLFDGIPRDGIPDYASTAHIARILDLPVLLVIDCSRLSGSVAAIARGYRTLDPRVSVAGVILNRVGSDRHLHLLQNALESVDIRIFGCFYREEALTIPDRHLGLIPTDELSGIDRLREELITVAKNSLDWNRLLPLLSPPSLPSPTSSPSPRTLRIGIARDRVFNFYYQDNLDILEELGAEVVFWSPLDDRSLPANLHGLYFGGGFPEIFARGLSENRFMLDSVRDVIRSGMPVYAECGGLMYLCEGITDFEGKSFPMVGIIPRTAAMGRKLTLGYREGTALEETVLVQKGEIVRGHEFHRSTLTEENRSPIYSLRGIFSGDPIDEGWRQFNLHASYVHVHFGQQRSLPEKFFRHCLVFSRKDALD